MMRSVFRKDSGRKAKLQIMFLEKKIRSFLIDRDVHLNVISDIMSSTASKMKNSNIRGAVELNKVFIKTLNSVLKNSFYSDQLPALTGIGLKQGGIQVVIICGVYGSGKTTFCGKFIHRIINSGETNFLPKDIVATSIDHQREFGQGQLDAICKKMGVSFYGTEKTTDLVDEVLRVFAIAKKQKATLLVIDTPGCSFQHDSPQGLHISSIRKALDQTKVIFVLDGMMGQHSYQILQDANSFINIDDVAVTKMKDYQKNGTLLNASWALYKPPMFLSKSEEIEELEYFNCDDYLSTFFDQEKMIHFFNSKLSTSDVEIAKPTEIKNLVWLETQLHKANNVKAISSMIKDVKDPREARLKFYAIQAKLENQITILRSMTKKEKIDPELLNNSRMERIAKGSGTSKEDVAKLCDKILYLYNNQ